MATIKELAAAAGVSIGTVDRVLHGRGRVAEETKRRIFASVEKLGYQPDPHARALVRKKPFRIAAVLPCPENDSGYWQSPLSGIRDAAAEYASFGIALEEVHFDRYRCPKIPGALSKLAANPPDGVLLTGIHAGRFAPALAPLLALPHAVFDTTLPQDDRRLAFFGQDSRRSGLLAGRLMKLLLPEGGDILATRVEEENEHAIERVAGFAHALSDDPRYGLRIVTRPQDDPVGLLKTAAHPDTAGLFVADASVGEAAAYLQKRKLSPKVIGYDVTEKTRQALRDGRIDFAITQSPRQQGYAAASALCRFLLYGERPEHATHHMPIQIVTKENADDGW